MSPKTLYKYRDWDNSFHKRVVTHGELYFSSPGDFNDPFDSTVPYRFDATKEQLYDSALRVVTRKHPKYNLKKRKKLANEKLKENNYADPQNVEICKKKQYEIFNNCYGVYSLTGDPVNILMWSHYAHSHSGLCIGFDLNKLDEFANSFLTDFNLMIGIYKMEYLKDYPQLNFF